MIFFIFSTGNANNVRMLIEHGAHVNAVDADNHTALFFAIKNGNIRNIVKMNFSTEKNPNRENIELISNLSAYAYVKYKRVKKS